MNHRDAPIKSGWPRPVLGEDDFDVPEDDQAEFPTPSRSEAASCLVAAALDGAACEDVLAQLTAMTPCAHAIVVLVPTAAWVQPVEQAFERIDGRLRIFARDGTSKSAHKAEVGNAAVSSHLSAGRSVVGVASSLQALPRVLIDAADFSIEIKVDEDILAKAITRFVGTTTGAEAFEGLASLDFHDIVSAFRAGSTSTEIYARLRTSAVRRARPRGDRLPRLVDAVEYGRARDWALMVCKLFKEFRAGNCEWDEVRAHAHCVWAGPSGVGKTHLAKMLSNELGIPLIATSISEMFASSSTGTLDSVLRRVRDIFATSGYHAILWDEFEALPSRVNLAKDNRSASFWTPVVAEFLLALDSAVSGERVGQFVWAATNFPERVDAALLRPGRLDRLIHFTLPDPAGIASILRHHLGTDLEGADLAHLGQMAIGRSHAEVAAVVQQARSAARLAGRPLRYGDLVENIAPRADLDDATLRRVALHEAGHAVVALALGVDEVLSASVGGPGQGFGRTLLRQRATIETRASIEDRVCAHLGGRAAEALIHGGDCSANAESDLAAATQAIAGLHASAGLGSGLAYLGDEKAATALLRVDRTLREAVNADLARLQARAVEVLRGNREALEKVAAQLADRHHLTGADVRMIFEAAQARSTQH